MRGYNKLHYRPYVEPHKPQNKQKPYICRIVPCANSFEIEWFNQNGDNKGTLYYSKLASGQWSDKQIQGTNVVVKNLDEYCDYEFYVETEDGVKSNVRKVRTGFVDGTVVDYLHPEDLQYWHSGRFIGSPSLVKLPSGALLASHDIFGTGSSLTILFRSDDFGKTWRYVTDIRPMFWGKLFVHKGDLYILGSTTDYGDLIISRSVDEGVTWEAPTVIMHGTSSFGNEKEGPEHCSVPVVSHNGRLWTTMHWGGWHSWDGGENFCQAVLSIDENADLLVSENWSITEFLGIDKKWDGYVPRAGALEGNIVLRPDGELIDMTRYWDNKSMIFKIDADNPEKKLEFEQILDFDMAHSKFEILRRGNGEYIAVGNRLPKRNILSVYRSKDTIHWEFVKDIVNRSEFDEGSVGFQYPSCLIDGDTLYVLSRTAYNRAMSFHDANYLTFHEVKLW